MKQSNSRYALSVAERQLLSNDIGLSARTLGDYLAGQIELPDKTVRMIKDSILDLGLGSQRAPQDQVVALMIPDLTSPYFAKMAQCIEHETQDLGWDLVVVLTGNDVRREVRLLSRFAQWDVVGVLLFTNSGHDATLRKALALRNDVVAFAETIAGTSNHTVASDLLSVGTLAGSHLKALGHRTFGYIGGLPKASSTQQIGAAFAREVAPRIHGASDYMAYLGEHSVEHGYETILRLFEQKRLPTAILAGSSLIAQGVVRAASRLGVRVPKDLSLIAFDDSGPLDLLEPPITSVSVDMTALAQKGVGLLRRLSGRTMSGVSEKQPVTLIVRGSTTRPSQFSMLGCATA